MGLAKEKVEEETEECEQTQGEGSDWLSRDDMLSLAPPGWTPSHPQLRFLTAYLAASPTASRNEIARSVGIGESTVRAWRNRSKAFCTWVQLCALQAIEGQIPAMWKALIERAKAGSDRAAHMVGVRFDIPYREACQRTPAPGPKGNPKGANLSKVLKELKDEGPKGREGGNGGALNT